MSSVECKGCYWCKHRKGLTCKFSSQVIFESVLRKLKRVPIEDNLQYPLTMGEVEGNLDEVDGYIGEDCNRKIQKTELFVFR